LNDGLSPLGGGGSDSKLLQNFVSLSNSNIQDYYPISPREAANWVRKNMEARKASISPKTNNMPEVNSP
jgi:hypothetical protein